MRESDPRLLDGNQVGSHYTNAAALYSLKLRALTGILTVLQLADEFVKGHVQRRCDLP